MGLVTMVIFLTMITLMGAWAYLGGIQHSPMDMLIPLGLGAGTSLLLIAEIEDSPEDFIMAVMGMVMGTMMAIPIFNSIRQSIG